MKRGEFTPCLSCGAQVGRANGLLFYQVQLTRMMFDHRAIQQTAGLEQILRSPALADVFAPDPELAKPLGEPETFLLCDDCAMKPLLVAALEEIAASRRANDTAVGASSVDTGMAAAPPPPVGVPEDAAADEPPPQEAA